jgi:hypothetical protein
MTERTSSIVQSFSTVAILKLLLCLFMSSEVVRLLLLPGGEYIHYLNPCLPTQCRNPFSGNKIGNLTFLIALVYVIEP